jgi:hypothetical protein
MEAYRRAQGGRGEIIKPKIALPLFAHTLQEYFNLEKNNGHSHAFCKRKH